MFGEESNKDLLIDFLNELLYDEQGEIVDLTYLNNEQLGRSELDRRAIFNLYCENERGEKFIVELQKAKQNFFKDRSVYYATFPIAEQAKQGANWNFELKAVYTIGILDFVFDEDKNDDKYFYKVKLTDIETHKVFYDKLTFICLQMPKFTKSVDELDTRFDKWLYILKNLSQLDDIPPTLQEYVFNKLFNIAEISKFSQAQYQSYENSLKYYRDLKNSLDKAYDEGFDKGFDKGAYAEKLRIANKLKAMNTDMTLITQLTGLSSDDIDKL